MEIVQIIITLIIIIALSILTYSLIKDGNPWTNIFVKNETILDKENTTTTIPSSNTTVDTNTKKVTTNTNTNYNKAFTNTNTNVNINTNENTKAPATNTHGNNNSATEIFGELGNSRRVCFDVKCPVAPATYCPPCLKNQDRRKQKKTKCNARPCRTISSCPVVHRCTCRVPLCNLPRRCNCSVPQPWGYGEWE